MYQLELEKRGIPTVTIVTSDFIGLAEAIMRGSGTEGMSFVVVPHPIGGKSEEGVLAKVDAAFPEILRKATEWKPKRKLPTSEPPYPAERFKFSGNVEEVNKLFFERGYSLGLPLIPPTPESVKSMLKGTKHSPDEVLWAIPPRKGVLTVELVATHAVMAGCKPEYIPLLLAIVEAMKDPKFDWATQTVTTNPTFPLFIVNGPIVNELGIGYAEGAAGGWYHPNVSIGYFVNLIGGIVGGSKPPSPGKSTLGQPGNIVAMVIGENIYAVPSWEPLNVERGYSSETNTVTAIAVEGISNINIAAPRTAKGILDVVAIEMATIGRNNVVMWRGRPGEDAVLLLSPQNAEVIANEGWSKKDVKQYLFEHANIPYEKWWTNVREVYHKDPWYARFGPGDIVPILESPDDLIVAVAGGAGCHNQYLSGFLTDGVVTKPIG